MRIKFGELHLNQKSIDLANECFKDNWNSLGPKTELLEAKYSELFSYKHSVAVNSGTSALICALLTLYDKGAKRGDEVIVPALSFIASATAITFAGFTPVFVDIKEDLTIDETKIPQAITDRTVAIIAVNLMGTPADLPYIRQTANIHGLTVICDNCEAYGSTIHDNFSLKYADFEVASFYVAHIISAGMESGMVSCKTKEDADLIKSVRSHGRAPNSLYFNHSRLGGNFKPTDVSSALLLGEIDNFWLNFENRKGNYYHLRQAMRKFDHLAWFTDEDVNTIIAPHGFNITLRPPYTSSYDRLVKHLDQNGIESKKSFGAMPNHGCFSYLNIPPGTFPVAEYFGDFGLHLGIHQYLSNHDLDHITTTLEMFFEAL